MVKVKDALRDKVFWMLLVGLLVVSVPITLLYTSLTYSPAVLASNTVGYSHPGSILDGPHLFCDNQWASSDHRCSTNLIWSSLHASISGLYVTFLLLIYGLARQWSGPALLLVGYLSPILLGGASSVILEMLSVTQLISLGDITGGLMAYIGIGVAVPVLILARQRRVVT